MDDGHAEGHHARAARGAGFLIRAGSTTSATGTARGGQPTSSTATARTARTNSEKVSSARRPRAEVARDADRGRCRAGAAAGTRADTGRTAVAEAVPPPAAPERLVESGVPADWYPDPGGRHQYRYWDGNAWTDRVADDGVQADDPLRWAPPLSTPSATATPDVVRVEVRETATAVGGASFRSRVGSLRNLWIFGTVVFAVLTVGYLVLPVSESATRVDGTTAVVLECGSVVSPKATATRAAEFTGASSVCAAARRPNEVRATLFGFLAGLSLLLAGFAVRQGRRVVSAFFRLRDLFGCSARWRRAESGQSPR